MRIFISSTFVDLELHRCAVRDVILRLGYQPVGMEYFGARPADPQSAALSEIEKCGALIGIYAYRFGWVPDSDTRSITEQEFDFACAQNIPCFCYRVRKDFPWDDSLKETGAKAAGLERFLAKIDSQLLRAEFSTPEDLASKVAADLGRELVKPQPSKTTEEYNRQKMLELVKNTWVKGKLEQSLHHDMFIQLGMEARPGAVEHPWDTIVQMPDQPNSALPPGTRSIEVFDQSGCSLLILGEPGSGKTTMLLELARDTIKRAEQDASQPIPVVFNLSSWSDPKQSIANWLITELGTRYYVPKKVASAWVKNDKLLPLLDGLDEVDRTRQEECVRAINTFRVDHGLAPLVVCSRIADYEILKTRLSLSGAVLLQPLTYEQADKYIETAGPSFTVLRNALRDDAALRELAESPLMLSLIVMTWGEQSAMPNVQEFHLDHNWRNRIFDLYVQQRMHRRIDNRTDAPAQSLRWLTFMAQVMERYRQPQFLIERLQPFWLNRRRDRLLYEIGIRIISSGMFMASSIFAGIIWYFVGNNIELQTGLVAGIIIGVVFLISNLLASIIARWTSGWIAIVLAIGIVVILGAILLNDTEVSVGGSMMVEAILQAAFIFGLPAALAGVTISKSEIMMVDHLTWSWKRGWFGIILILGPSIITLLAIALSGNTITSMDVMVAMSIGSFVGVPVTITTGFTRRTTVPKTTRPNEGFRRSLRNALYAAMVVFPVIAISGAILVRWGAPSQETVNVAIAAGVFFALPYSLTAGLVQGGAPCVQHLFLRFVLFACGCLPWNCRAFLDDAVKRTFVYRVGGAYIFFHPLLQDYFAQTAECPGLVKSSSTTLQGGAS